MDTNWLVPTAVAIIIAIPIATLVGYLVFENIKARRNRAYKTLQEHSILNAGSRENWMAGVLPGQEVKELGRFSTLIAPILQLATVIGLAIIIVLSNNAMDEQSARQRDQISALEAQMHALAFAASKDQTAPKIDPDPSVSVLPQSATPGASPMQVACANLIGRVADAYEKGESSKIASSLEELVKKLKCVNGMPP
jgi:hypothetical protein